VDGFAVMNSSANDSRANFDVSNLPRQGMSLTPKKSDGDAFYRTDADGQASRFRAKRLKYAIVTALLSKGGAAMLQLVAIPITIRSLGVSGYALYAGMAAVVGWLNIPTISIGPALVVQMAAAAAAGDERAQRRLFTSAFFPIAVNVVLLSAGVLVMMLCYPMTRLFNSEFAGWEQTIYICLWIMGTIQLIQPLFAVVEAAQAGYQEQYVLNLRGLSGNLGCVVALVLIPYWPTLIYMVCAMQGPQFLSRLANSVWFFWRRAFLVPGLASFRWRDCRMLIGDGLLFSLAGTATAYLCHQFPVIALGWTRGSQASASFAAGITLITMAASVVSMICIPLWPAIADCVARHDYQWARRACRRVLLFTVGVALFVAAALAFAGAPLFAMCFGPSLVFSRSLPWWLGLYFIVLTWEQVHYYILVAMGKVAVSSSIYLSRAVLSILITSLVGGWADECYLFIVMSAVGATTTCPLFFYLLRRALSPACLEGTKTREGVPIRVLRRQAMASINLVGGAGE
jgi:O-antigen/teichoic acid export membrane protein